MRIRINKKKRGENSTDLNLASMIDVTFLLLIYFMVTMVLSTTEDRLSPTLQTKSEEGSGQFSDFQPQVVEVRLRDGVPIYRLGERVLADRAALESALAALPKDPGLFVRGHDAVPVGFAVTAIQVGRDVGFEQVTYVPSE